MNTRSVVIPSISCHHCVRTITNELQDIEEYTQLKLRSRRKKRLSPGMLLPHGIKSGKL